MRKPRIQPGLGSTQRGLDDRRAHDVHRHVALHLGERASRRVPLCTRTRRASRATTRASVPPGSADRTPSAVAAARSSPRVRACPRRRARGVPPSGSRASRLGSRLAASASARARRAAATSTPPVDAEVERAVADQLLRARRRDDCRRRSRSTPTRGVVRTPRLCSVSTMRTGPSRLTSTASSIGESNDTVAAEWMTMSHAAERLAAGVVEAEAVGARRHR